jgi:TolB-like protein/Flp pilus assembly protein TadD
MNCPDNPLLRIGTLRVDPRLDEISKDGAVIKLQPRTMRLLVCLAEHAGDVVSVEQLLDQVWKDVVVTPDSVYQAIAMLRRVIGDDAKDPNYIANVLRRGYRLVAPVSPWLDAPLASDEDLPTVAAASYPPRATAIAAGPRDESIAVLPFADMSESRDQGYFADGMAEELLTLLAKVPGLRVIGRTSCSRFKDERQDLRTIGNLLGAAYVVEGSVRKSGNRLRVTVQLIDTHDGSPLWSESYDKECHEALEIQQQIAASLVRALQVAVGVDLPSRPILKSAAGYDLYKRGRHALDRFDKAGFESAEGYFQQALALDPTALRAAESLALVHLYMAEWGYAPPREGFERARQSFKRVLELDPTSAMAHCQLACIHAVYDWDPGAAVDKIRRALELDPRDPGILVTAGMIYLSLDQMDEATGFVNAALALDPMGAVAHSELGTICYRTGRYAEAEAKFRTSIEISPTFAWNQWTLGMVLLAAGKSKQALAQMRKITSDELRDAGLAIVYHAMNRKADSNAALYRVTQSRGHDQAYLIAEVHASRGEIDEAFAWLDRAHRQKDVSLYRIRSEPLFRNLKPDERYNALLRKMTPPSADPGIVPAPVDGSHP